MMSEADDVAEEAREKEIKLAPVIKHIRQSFKGDERFMILQTYYRQNDYSPLNVLKSSVSLLLQIPSKKDILSPAGISRFPQPCRLRI